MHIELDGKLAARGALCERIDRLERELPRLSVRALCARIDELRSMAAGHRLMPAETIAARLSTLVAEDRRALVRPYLGVLREAVGCERSDAAAGEAFLAAVGIRLAH
jgi:hypothetical protein